LSVFAHDQAALDHLRELDDMRRFGFAMPQAMLGRDELSALEPALTGPAVKTGYLIPGQRYVDPRTVTKGLKAKLIAMGVQLLEGVSVVGFERVGGSVRSIKTSGAPVSVDQVLIAAGAWSTGLCRLLGFRLPVQAGKGYSFSVEMKDLPKRPLYLAEARIACTPMAGRLRLAGTMELSGTNLELKMNRVAAICTGAAAYLVGWSCSEKKEIWTGMRPMTPDGLPVMGAIPDCPNVFVATGHGMLGITLGPPSGKAVAQNMVTGTLPPVLKPFQFARHH
jgi:D-amino-acid dehydrogenase